MSDEFTLTLNSPITEEQWDMIADVDFDHTNEITFHTKHGKEVKFVKADAQPERKTGWIPCRERLPEEHIGFYLVTVQKMRITALNVVGCDNTVHDIDIARWDYDRRAPQRGYHWCKADKVIAWMPLPEPYKEESNK